MKCRRSPSRYRYVIGRDWVETPSSFSPALKVFSTTAPESMLRSRVLTNAPPLPGLTCWKNRMVKRLPSTRMALPFLNWLVDIMPEAPFEMPLRVVSRHAQYRATSPALHADGPAPARRYYRTDRPAARPLTPAPHAPPGRTRTPPPTPPAPRPATPPARAPHPRRARPPRPP